MEDSSVFEKSPFGVVEVTTQMFDLSNVERAILMSVDGKRTVEEIRLVFASMGDPIAILQKLLAENLVQLASDASSSATTTTAATPVVTPSVAMTAVAPAPAAAPPVLASAPVAAPAPTLDAGHRVMEAKRLMSETVVALSGIRSYMFTLKIERANTLDDLRELMGQYTEIVRKHASKADGDRNLAQIQAWVG